ncbi:MAG: hypothetical protein K8T10_00120 [Candidatus Eremiobacteraeota bacterium]|nr:hypothetical protein [Candidatus Eremiobacteraeota bacterium]
MNEIQGIDKVIFSKLPERRTVLIEGETGVLKTTFVLECLKHCLKRDESNICVFVSLKEDKNFYYSHEEFGDFINNKRLFIIDYDDIIDRIGTTTKSRDMFDGFSSILSEYYEKYGDKIKILAIDPVNVMETDIGDDNIRRVLFHFFSYISELSTNNWIVIERGDNLSNQTDKLPYHFLADGIIRLGMMETLDDVIRYIEIVKMRGVNHSLKRFQLSHKKDGIKILSAIHES